MIAYLTGKISSISQPQRKESYFIVDVGGVGFLVFTTIETLNKLKVGENITIHTYLNVREDALELYGFLKPEEANFFKLLISISGIGPKSALNILELAELPIIQKAVLADQPEILEKIQGISKIMAEKIVLGLQNKIKELAKGMDKKTVQDFQDDSEIADALVSLGFSQSQVKESLKQISPEIKNKEERLKAALKVLGKK